MTQIGWRYQTVVWAAALAIALLAVACTRSGNPAAPSGVALTGGPQTFAGGAGNCFGGDAIKDESSPFTINAPAGEVFTSVSVKAGRECTFFNADGSDGCYTVTGIGTGTVTVTGGGTGPTCKAISHIEGITEHHEEPPHEEPPH